QSEFYQKHWRRRLCDRDLQLQRPEPWTARGCECHDELSRLAARADVLYARGEYRSHADHPTRQQHTDGRDWAISIGKEPPLWCHTAAAAVSGAGWHCGQKCALRWATRIRSIG